MFDDASVIESVKGCKIDCMCFRVPQFMKFASLVHSLRCSNKDVNVISNLSHLINSLIELLRQVN